METILPILLTVVIVLLSFVVWFFYVKTQICARVNGEISAAEDTQKQKEEKRDLVVEQLLSIIPAPLKIVFTHKVLTALVQAAFDKIEEYAEKQVAKKSAALLEGKEK